MPSDASRAEIAALESRIEILRAETISLTSLVGEVADVKENTRALIRQLAEQRDQNEQLQSDLDNMQQNYDILFDEMERAEASSEKANNSHAEEMKKLEASKSKLEGDLKARIARMKKEFSAAIALMVKEISREREARKKANDKVVRLSMGLIIGREKEHRKNKELRRLSSRVEGWEAAAVDGEASSKSEADRLSNELGRQRGESRREKSRLESELRHLKARVREYELAAENKSEPNGTMRHGDETKQEQETLQQIEECKAISTDEVENIGELQLEVERLKVQSREFKMAMEKESESNKMLRSDLERATNERENELKRVSDLESEVDRLNQAVADAEASMQKKDRDAQQRIEEHETALKSEIEKSGELRLEVERAGIRAREFQTAVDEESASNRALRSDIEGIIREKDEALKDLESKVDRLSKDMGDAEEAAHNKDREARQQIGEYETALKNEAEKLGELQLEVARLNAQVEESKTSMENQIGLNKTLRSDLEEMARERGEALKCVSDLDSKSRRKEQEVQRKIKGYKMTMINEAEKSRVFEMEVEGLNVRAEGCKTAMDEEYELNRTLQFYLERVSGEKDEALKCVSDLESKIGLIRQELDNAETSLQEKEREMQRQKDEYELIIMNEAKKSRGLQVEVEQLNAETEGCRTAMDNKSESNGTLQSDHERARRGKDEALECISDLESKIELLTQQKADKDIEMQQIVDECKWAADEEAEKTRELQLEVGRANAQVEACKATMDEISALNRKLQSDLEQLTSSRDEAFDQLGIERAMLEEAEGVLLEKSREKDLEIQQLEVRAEECNEARKNEADKSRILQLEVERAAADICEERRLRYEALKTIDGLNSVIATHEENLRDMAAVKENAETVMEDKSRELKRMSSRMDAYKAASDSASLENMRLQRVNSELTRKIDQLSRDLSAAKKDADTMKNRDYQWLNKRIEEYEQNANITERKAKDPEEERLTPMERPLVGSTNEVSTRTTEFTTAFTNRMAEMIRSLTTMTS